jgi:DNA-binding NarL/FixJ family response regulator
VRSTSVRALIVEDNRNWQRILAEILTDVGLTVDLAEDLQTAVAKLRAEPHRLAVVDLSLGGDYRDQDGLRVLEAVRRHDPGCVPLLLTGFATVELAVSALTEYGAFTCLRKESFRRAEFRELVGRALAEARAIAATQPTADNFPNSSPEHQATDEKAPTQLALVVEDDAGWRSILFELLIEAGYQPRLCSSFGQARGYLRREKYALAVVDLSLSGSIERDANMDGYQLLINTQMASIPTIIVSGVATLDDIERAYTERGIFACFEKQSFDRRVFLNTVGEVRDAARANTILAHLTRREREVLELVAQGLSNKEIAQSLVITNNTVKRHLKSIFEKLGVHSRAAAAAQAISAGIPAGRVEADTALIREDQDTNDYTSAI